MTGKTTVLSSRGAIATRRSLPENIGFTNGIATQKLFARNHKLSFIRVIFDKWSDEESSTIGINLTVIKKVNY